MGITENEIMKKKVILLIFILLEGCCAAKVETKKTPKNSGGGSTSSTRVRVDQTIFRNEEAPPAECFSAVTQPLHGLKELLPVFENYLEKTSICQTTWGTSTFDGLTEETKALLNGKVYYITVYSNYYKIPLYSAFIASRETTDRIDGWQKGNDATDDYYKGFGEIYNRGHLYAHRYAGTKYESKATMKMTNVVPQDNIFNQVQWSGAEEKIKELAKQCDPKAGCVGCKAFVIVGSIPGFFGNHRSRPFKLGCKTSSPQDGFCKREDQVITAPTHLYTTMRCLRDTREKKEILYHASFIGHNHENGEIVWYENFNTFIALVSTMLARTDKEDRENMENLKAEDYVSRGPSRRDCKTWDEKLHGFNIPNDNVQNWPLSADFQTLSSKIKAQNDPSDNQDLINWENQKIISPRKKKLLGKIELLLHHSGLGNLKVEFTKNKDVEMLRRRRSTNEHNDADETERQLKCISFENNDPSVEIELLKVEFAETSNGAVVEKFTIDYEKNELIEKNENLNGNSVDVSRIGIDGTKTVMTKKKSTMKHFFIRLVGPKDL